MNKTIEEIKDALATLPFTKECLVYELKDCEIKIELKLFYNKFLNLYAKINSVDDIYFLKYYVLNKVKEVAFLPSSYFMNDNDIVSLPNMDYAKQSNSI